MIEMFGPLEVATMGFIASVAGVLSVTFLYVALADGPPGEDTIPDPEPEVTRR